MKKTLLLTTCVMISTSVWAFGGVGIFGHKSHHSSGVSSIGVHYNGTDDKPNIDIRNCDSETEELVGSECCLKTLIYTDNDTTKCCSTEGYAVQDGKCKKQCAEGLVLNEETNDCEDACPAERRCGETCCGEGNVCHPELNICCVENYEDFDIIEDGWEGVCCETGMILIPKNEDEKACCPPGSSWASYEEECCPIESSLFPTEEGSHCCPPGQVGYCYTQYEEPCHKGGCCSPDKILYDEYGNGTCLE